MLKARCNRISVLSAITLFFMLIALGCSKNEPLPKKNAGPESIPVKAQRVSLSGIEQRLDYVGNVKAQEEAAAYPKVTGKISAKMAREGDVVKKGDVIAYVDRDEVGLKFEKGVVESPLDGVIGRVFVDIGESVTAQTQIALVVDMEKVKIDLDMPEIYLPKIFTGQEAKITVDAYPQEVIVGKVTRISPVVNLENRAAPLEITVDNSGHRLKSGMFARVSLSIEKRLNIPVVLKEAIIGRDPDNYVYIIQENKAKIRKISLGIHDGPLYEVKDGLKDGDLVVILGQQRLYEDAPVIVEMNNGNAKGDIQ